MYADVLSKGLDLVAKQAAADAATAVRISTKSAAEPPTRTRKPTLKAVSKATSRPTRSRIGRTSSPQRRNCGAEVGGAEAPTETGASKAGIRRAPRQPGREPT